MVLASCATPQGGCDATDQDVSLLTKMSCDHSGGYRAQITTREQELLDARTENAAFHQVYEDIKAEQAAVSLSLAEQERSYAALQNSTDMLLKQLKVRYADRADVQKQIVSLQADLRKNRTITTSSSSILLKQREKERAELLRKVQRLQLSLGFE